MGRLSQIKERRDIGHFGVALYDPKNGFNVGGSIRAAGAFGASYLVASGTRWKEKGNWRHMDTEGAHIRMPVYLGVQDVFSYLPYGVEVVAVEISANAVPMFNFQHPQAALYVFGPEDGALPRDVVDKCQQTIYIPTEYSLNLYSTVTAVAYDRESKLYRLKNDVSCPNCQRSHWRSSEDGYHCNACGHEWTL